MQWWQVRWTVPWQSAEALAGVLQEWPEIQGVAMEGGPREAVKNPEFGEWMDEQLSDSETTEMSIYVPESMPETELRERLGAAFNQVASAGLDLGAARETLCLELLDESSWENAWKDGFQPMPIGERLMVVPKWWEDEVQLNGRIPVILEPGMAFGTGTHATTQLCLEALQRVPLNGASVIDVGCGTAVLAIAAAKLGAARVLAIDIDPVATAAARGNVADNNVADVVQVETGDLLSPAAAGQCDLLIANILRDILLRMMPQAAQKVAPGGRIVLSGIVTSQETPIRESLRQHGFIVEDRLVREDWVALVGRRTP
ncbi:ribosomal protein L11 methyltransferase [Alicyclobacillus contaminans]|uniref:50S ribosomal protein L11 methyltransferase n=1 Tax=Alicyclobacillus contaminans TaxID=392016 RepID=UPI000414DFB7|nr:50S ribosomal protein L11 methyltransferase [Alicyclobacillus contaminans]GMA52147.1 ribosomal protein L11 methyltransferase [Alicyclobacillus contaminans]